MDSQGIVDKEQYLLAELIAQIKTIVFDFDGVFTDNKVWVFDDGKEAVCCSRADGLGLRLLDKLKLDYFILSSEENPVVKKRASKLCIPCVNACQNKLEFLKNYTLSKSLNFNHLAFVGNDINDKDCLEQVALPIVVADAHDSVKPLARYITRKAGGQGAVREVCDVFYHALSTN